MEDHGAYVVMVFAGAIIITIAVVVIIIAERLVG